MSYLLPRLEVTGKLHVWSVDILPVTSMDFKNVVLVWTLVYGGGTDGVVVPGVLLSMEGVVVILVDRTFCRCWLRFPWAVASALGRCLRTSLEMRLGQVV